MAKFSLGAAALSWLDVVTSSTEVNYDAKLDPRTDGVYDTDPCNAGGAVLIEQSIGDGGRGSAKFVVTGEELPGVLDVLNSWDPTVENPQNLTAAQIVEQTIRMEYSEAPKDATKEAIAAFVPEPIAVCFKVSLKPHTREIKIPVEHFEGFQAFLHGKFVADDGETIERAVEYYRSDVAKIEAAEAAKLAKKMAAEERVRAATNAGK